MRLVGSLVAAFFVSACVGSGEQVEPPPAQMALDLSEDAHFFASGFPSDSKRDGLTLDLSGFAQHNLPLVADYIRVAELNASGFTTMLPVYLPLQGLDGDQLRFLPSADDYAFQTAPVQLINIDPESPDFGQRFPLELKFQSQADSYRPQGLLQARNVGRYLAENTHYAVVATKALAKPGIEINQHPLLSALLAQHTASDLTLDTSEQVRFDKLRPGFTLLSQLWHGENNNPSDIIAATVWKTGQPSAFLSDLLAPLDVWPLEDLSSGFELQEQTDEYCIIKADWQVPGFQQGVFPYVVPANGGAVVLSEQGLDQVYQRQTPIHLTIPKTPMPAQGFGLYFYHHGTSGLSSQVYERGQTTVDGVKTWHGSPASIAAQAGLAAAGMGGHFGKDHNNQVAWTKLLSEVLPIDLNIGQYNFLNIQAMAGHLHQQLAERYLFRRLVEQLSLAPELCPGVDLGGATHIGFNPQQQVIAGQSLGAFTALGVALNDAKPHQAIVLSGAGSYNLRLVMNITAFGTKDSPLGNILLPLFFNAKAGDVLGDEFHPLWAISDLALAHADVAYSAAAAVEQKKNDNNLLVFQGFYDDWVGTPSQRQLTQALSLDFAGFDPAVLPADQLLPAALWSQAQQRLYPLQANRGDKTQASVRYNEDGILSGHHVLFQYPEAQQQLLCYLDGVIEGEAPVLLAPGQSCR